MTFRYAANQVFRRWLLISWLDGMRKSALIVTGAGVLLFVLCGLFGMRGVGATEAAVYLAAWMALMLLIVLFQRPSRSSLLALWDERARRQEMFVSALAFEGRTERTPGQEVHLLRASERLREELPELRKHLPLPNCGRAAMPAIVFFALASSGVLVPDVAWEDRDLGNRVGLDEDHLAEALRNERNDLNDMEKLTPEEREKVGELDRKLAETTEKLGSLSGKTPREVLEELEQRALEAEQLAEEMGESLSPGVSSDMIAEMERHADTAPLASALRAGDLNQTAAEAKALAERIASEDLSVEAEKRIRRALRRSLDRANEKDKKTKTFEQVDKSLQHLSKSRQHRAVGEKKESEEARRKAADEFRNLAKHFDTLQKRREARRKLQRFAQQLRNLGAQAVGGKPTQLRRLSKGNQNGKLGNLSQSQRRRLMKRMPFQGLPGRQQPGGNSSQRRRLLGPMPQGSGKGGLSIPIPGTGGNRPGQGMIPGGNGGAPVPGAGQQGNSGAVPGAGQGGLEAGHGSAPYGGQRTKPHEASKTGVVAPMLGEGESRVRATDAGTHREDALRSTHELTIEFLKAEEDALSEEPLPPSRRQQVLRYFRAIRERIGNEEGPAETSGEGDSAP